MTDQAQRIQRAFIDGIRTVAVIDDQMRSYPEVVRRETTTSKGGDAAPPVPKGEESVNPEEEYAPADTALGAPVPVPPDAAGFPPSAGEESMNPEDEYAPARTASVVPAPVPSDAADSSLNTPAPLSSKSNELGMKEDDAAAALISDFRRRGWFHDIRNDRFEDADELAQKCDLIILDYMLGKDSDASVRILSKLAQSDRMHLVVLYTREDERPTWLKLVCILAGEPAKFDLTDEERGEYDKWSYDDKPIPQEQDVAQCLTGRWKIPDRPEPPKGKKAQREAPLERWGRIRTLNEARRTFSDAEKDRRRLEIQPAEHMDISKGENKWVRCDNVFIVIQQKTHPPLQGDKIIERLTAALAEWDPSFLRLMLRHARYRFATQGLSADGKLLRGKRGEAAWLIYANTGSPEERIERRRRIYNRLFEGFIHEIINEWSVDTDILDAHEYAATKTGIDKDSEKDDIYFHLNEVLAFEEKIPPYLRTGTLFTLPDKQEWIGVCVSPECDLVPRGEKVSQTANERPKATDRSEADTGKEQKGSDKKPEPKPSSTNVVLWRALRLMPWTSDNLKACTKALEEAELVKHLFLRFGNPEQKYVIDLKAALKPNAFFVANSGRIAEEHFTATRVEVDDSGIPTIETNAPKSYKVIGQLREAYATRLLHETGHQLSRVGVDFVRLPEKKK